MSGEHGFRRTVVPPDSPRTVTARTIAHSVLREALQASQTDWGHEAARQLLIDHGYWLRRGQFLALITLEQDALDLYAHVDWAAAANFAAEGAGGASTSEAAILRLACSLAGHLPTFGDLTPSDLREWSIYHIVRSFDRANDRRAIAAFTRAVTGTQA